MNSNEVEERLKDLELLVGAGPLKAIREVLIDLASRIDDLERRLDDCEPED